MSYQLVEQLHKKAVPVGPLCRVLGVSRSGYYDSRQRAKLAPKACLGERHHLHPHAQRLAVLGRGVRATLNKLS